MGTIGLIWRTVRHLHPKQVVYQIFNRLRGPGKLRLPERVPATCFLSVPMAGKPVSCVDRTFTFLNQAVSFPNTIDWNYAQNGKLWTYNLNYFDYLNQASSSLPPEEGLRLMLDFITQTSVLRDGLEPYPTSLRINNWVHFLCRNRLEDDRVNAHLFAQVSCLNNRLEYHIGGNHLLENGFALLTGALYFRSENWFGRASRLIREELMRQLLTDGAHDERSPMYQQILLDRLLDALIMLQADPWYRDPAFLQFVSEKATRMRCWLEAITFRNGDVPMVNDTAFGIAPGTAQIRAKAVGLLVPLVRYETGGGESGYRMFRQPRYELFVDVGSIGSDYQPGHAHADTFSFILHVDGQPILVDSGTSTYQAGSRRMWERSTAAHNTVEVNGFDSSEVWHGFRVGRRAATAILSESETRLSASHDGYSPLGLTTVRTWHVESAKFSILDELLGDISSEGSVPILIARFYFHPNVVVISGADCVTAGPIKLTFQSSASPLPRLIPYEMAYGFNRLQTGQCLEVPFTDFLNTIVTINE